MDLLSADTPAKYAQYFTDLLFISKFDKRDVISHLYTVTGQNLTQFSPVNMLKDELRVTLKDE